jgi:hypothetical protein
MKARDYNYIMKNLSGDIRLCRNTVLLKIIEIVTDGEPDLDMRIAPSLMLLRSRARAELYKRVYGRRPKIVGSNVISG